MDTMGHTNEACREVEDHLADILDGSASAALYDHVAECDQCRDLRHDASRAAEVVKSASADFRAPAGFADRILSKIDAQRGGVPASAGSAARSSMPAERSQRPTSQAAPSKSEVTRADSDAAPTIVRSSPPSLSVDDAARELSMAATTLDPLAAAREEAAPVQSGKRPADAPVAASSKPGATEVMEPVAHDTRPSPTRADEPSNTPSASAELNTFGSGSPAASSAPAPAKSGLSAQSTGARGAVAALPANDVPKAPADKKVAPAGGKVIPFFRRPSFVAPAALAIAAAASVGFWLKGRGTVDPIAEEGPWSGSVTAISRAASEKTGGFTVCGADGACSDSAEAAKIVAGSTLRTDARTRARVKLADGTWIALDRGTEVVLGGAKERSARIVSGTIAADIAPVKAEGATQAQVLPAAKFTFAAGEVEVLGTKLQITSAGDRASVEVARGSVKVRSASGQPVEVRAGEEATLLPNAEPQVAASSSLADVMEWSDQSQEEVDAPVLRGLGELRAKKPGQTQEKDHAVRLSKHTVKVRVVDVVAKTEIEEVFTNDTDEELEGIFRFPLPPGAQIEGLALEVNGKLEEGAFVDRDKGAAIWRGVIQNAAPKAQRVREEIIWVPGPWRDPALLEWQRGGRFELRIFPIPKRGSRRVVLKYTETVPQSGGIRRFTYPLAHDANGTTKIDSFDLDVQVLGHDKAFGVASRGYELTGGGEGAADRRTFHASSFVPSGDLTVEYALPDRDKEVTAWAYQMPVTSPVDVAPTNTATPSPGASSSAAPPIVAKTAEERAAIESARAIADDSSPFVAISVRPKLPRWEEHKERTHVLVVDTSRSMFGERFARARRLATSIVKEMDRRDSFVVLACDSTCRTLDGSTRPKPMVPGASAAADVEKFLGQIEPDGGSDMAAAISAARTAAGSNRDKEVRILYLGDGTPTVGPTRAAHLETAVRSVLPAGEGSIVAVALGNDADMTSLQAVARGGGGVVVPYVPGQKVSSAALDVLAAAYGVVLRDPQIELPAGLTQVTPSRMDPIRAGGETFVVARMTGTSEINGTVTLKGRVAGESFEQKYPVKVLPTQSEGNAFVARMYAAAKIAELEQNGGALMKPAVVELSKRFAVASQHTSLIVLESQAMFKAFGLDRGSVAPTFTGEVGATSHSADAEGDKNEAEEAREDADSEVGADKKKDASGGGGLGALGASRSAADEPFASPAAPAASAAPMATATSAPPAKAAKPVQSPAENPFCAPGDPLCSANGPTTRPSPGWRRPPPPPPRRLVAMRRVFERKGSFDTAIVMGQEALVKIAAAEAALQSQPDSRDKTMSLYALYATSGRLGEAQELTARWAGRDALDPDALIARADLAARQGDRERAIRILGGLADVRPGDKAIQTRLADMQDATLNAAFACQHRIALADMASTDVKLVTNAVSCARQQGLVDLAEHIKRDLDSKTRDAVEKALIAPAATQSTATSVRGDVQVTAEWNGGADLDLAIIDKEGKRTSWLGSASSKTTVTALNVSSTRSESLGVVGLGAGQFTVEVARAGGATDAASTGTISGELTIRVPGGGVRKVPFVLTGSRLEVGTVRVFFESKLVPVEGLGWGGGF